MFSTNNICRCDDYGEKKRLEYREQEKKKDIFKKPKLKDKDLFDMNSSKNKKKNVKRKYGKLLSKKQRKAKSKKP